MDILKQITETAKEERICLISSKPRSVQLTGIFDYEPFTDELILTEPSLIIPKEYFVSAGWLSVHPSPSRHPLHENARPSSYDVVYGQIPVSREPFFGGDLPQYSFSKEEFWHLERLKLAQKGWLRLDDVLTLTEKVDVAGKAIFPSTVRDLIYDKSTGDVQREWDVWKGYTRHQ